MFFFQHDGHVLLEKSFSPPSCEPLSPFINNVSCGVVLRSGAGYKEKCRCRSQERGSRGGTTLQEGNGLLAKIGCLLKRRALVSAGPGSDSASHSSSLPALFFHAIPSSTQRDISTGLLQGDLSRNRKIMSYRDAEEGSTVSRDPNRGLSSFLFSWQNSLK